MLPNQNESLYFRPEDSIQLNARQVIDLQVPCLSKILTIISNEQFDGELTFWGSPDVLSKKNYPDAYEIALDLMRSVKNLHLSQAFPDVNKKTLIVKNLHPGTKKKFFKEKIVAVTKTQPLCYAYEIYHNGEFLGEIIIVPVVTQRSASQALLDESPRVAYETLLVATDARSAKFKMKQPPKDLIEVIPDNSFFYYFGTTLDNPNEPAVLTASLNGSLGHEEIATIFSEQLSTLTNHWS
jgi:hypothetical protein